MIRFKNLVKKFGDRTVLKDISFEVAEGEIVFILGTSGTGKSVLLKTMVGLLPATSGEIWVGGRQVAGLTEAEFFEIRKECGMVFQHPALFDSLSVFENVAYGLRKHFRDWPEQKIRDRVRECLDLVNLSGVEHKLPGQLSYGMQKRASLARTVAINPKVLLFDEPTTGLDPVTTNAVNHLILDLSRKLKTTSMVVSHDMHCALDIADRIVVLDRGEVVARGTPEQLKGNDHPLVQDFLKEAIFGQAD